MAISTRLRLPALAIVLAFSLTGCGGGGGGDDPPPAPQPDLSISQFSAPSIGTVGSSISVNHTVSNNTNGAAGAFFVGIYLSTDNSISTADTRVGFRAIPSLAAGAVSVASDTVTIPSNLLAGTYFLGAIADDRSAVAESNENNNVSTVVQIALSAPQPTADLSATDFSAPSSGTAGATISVDSTVSNLGTAGAGPFEVGIYLSTDDIISTTDTLVGTRSVPGLAAGAVSTGATTVTLAGNLAAGTYFLGAIADRAGAVSESNESNNISSAAMIVVSALVPTIDLTVSAFTAPTSGAAGTTVSVSSTVSNLGNTGAGAFEVGIYLSTDNVISTTDTFVGTRSVSGLAAGATSAGATSVTLPGNLDAGTYFLGAIVDRANAVSESNEGNNVSTQVAIVVSAGAFTVSGTVSASSVTAVDSDTNDPLQQGRASNNGPSTAQRVANPALVIGYANRPRTGPLGPNFDGGDIFDGYQVTLAAGQVVELNFGDATAADLDLLIFNSTGTTLLAQSIGVTRSECVRITRAGEYQVVVYAYDGASNYELAWGPVTLGTTCPIATAASPEKPSFVTGQFFAKARPVMAGETRLARTASVARSANLTVASMTLDDIPVLLEMPPAANARAASMRALGRTGTPTSYGTSSQVALALDTAAAIKQLRASGEFEYVEPNGIVEAQQAGYGIWPPNDTLLNRMPHLDLIKLPDAFNALNSLNPRPTYTPIVAVLDTGIVADHPDLTRMLVAGFDFVSNSSNGGDGDGIDSNPDDSKPPTSGASFHGTHVAGTIAAETFNGAGVVGVAPMARIMPVRVLGSNGSGSLNDIIQALRFAAGLQNNSGTVPTRKADVINMSLGAQGTCSSAVSDVLQQVRAQGVIVVAAAGNDSGQPVGTPANCPGVVAVSAVSYSGALARYSNVGPEVMVTAPGGDNSRQTPAGTDLILSTHATFVTDSTTRTPNYASMQGTSMATPHVAGVMALMRAVNPAITPTEIDALFASGSLTDDVGAAGRDNQFGFGLINALKAITAAGGATPPPAGLPTLALSTTRLDFGSVQTQLQITLTRINGSTDSFASAIDSARNANAVTVVPAANNPANGPFVLNVTVDRALLNIGEDQIQVEITSTQGRKLRFDVVIAPRPSAPTGLLGVGPVYVLALDPNTFLTLAQKDVINNTTTYPYTLTDLTRPVIIVAGTDTDNDGYICGASEPCGAYPVLGAGIAIISASRNGVNFDLMTGISAAGLSGAQAQTRLPAPRGFWRIR